MEIENNQKVKILSEEIIIDKILCKRYCPFNSNFFDFLVRLDNFRQSEIFIELSIDEEKKIDPKKEYEENKSVRIFKNKIPQVFNFKESETCARTRGDGWRFMKPKSLKQDISPILYLKSFHLEKKILNKQLVEKNLVSTVHSKESQKEKIIEIKKEIDQELKKKLKNIDSEYEKNRSNKFAFYSKHLTDNKKQKIKEREARKKKKDDEEEKNPSQIISTNYYSISEQFLLDQIQFRLSSFFAQVLKLKEFEMKNIQEYRVSKLLQIKLNLVDILKFRQILLKFYSKKKKDKNDRIESKDIDFEIFALFSFHFCGSILWMMEMEENQSIRNIYSHLYVSFFSKLVCFHQDYSTDNLRKLQNKFPHLSLIISNCFICNNFKLILQNKDIDLKFYLIRKNIFQSDENYFREFLLYIKPNQIFNLGKSLKKPGFDTNAKFHLFYQEKEIADKYFDKSEEREKVFLNYSFPKYFFIRNIDKICSNIII